MTEVGTRDIQPQLGLPRLRRLTLGISNAISIAMSLPSSFFVNNHAEQNSDRTKRFLEL
jgi:hypothetical protein